jgi:hypothetical protein
MFALRTNGRVQHLTWFICLQVLFSLDLSLYVQKWEIMLVNVLRDAPLMLAKAQALMCAM